MVLSQLFGGARSCCFAVIAALSLISSGLVRAEGEGFEFAPDKSDVVACIQVTEILESPAFEKIAGEFPELAKNLNKPMGKQTKLTPRHIDSVFVAGNSTTLDFVIVFNLTREVGLNEVLDKGQQSQPTKVGEYTLYAVEDGQSLCLVDETTIVIGSKKTLTAVLKRDDEPALSDELLAAWENVDDEQHIYVVATLGAFFKKNTAAIPAGLPIKPETLAKLKSATFTISGAKTNIALSANLDCSDNATANQLKGLLDVIVQGAQQDANAPAEVKQALKSVKATTDKEWLTIGASFGIDTALSQFKSQIAEAFSNEAAE